MKLTLGFSSCPNDTFMFDALVNQKIDTEGLDFEVFIQDIENLNKKAMQEELDITKLSFSAFLYCIDKYILLNCGSALGLNCGPIFIKNPKTVINEESKIAIPGIFTTANLLLDLVYPELQNREELLFSEIEEAILNQQVDAGVIIHENRFTYQKKGLEKIQDLGLFWQEKTKLPIPLGGIFVKRTLEKSIQDKIQRVLKRSIEYAFANPTSSKEYVNLHAQELEQEVIESHIKLYVNEFSIDLGQEGKKAVRALIDFNRKSAQKLFL